MKKYKIIAKDDLFASPHSWTRELDYEVEEKDGFFSITSNEGQLNYVDSVKENVLDGFIVVE